VDRLERERRGELGRTHLHHLEQLRRGLGAVRLDRLDVQAVLDHAERRRAAGAGPVTLASELSYLSGLLRVARALWRLPVTPEVATEAREALRLVGRVRSSRRRERVLSDDEQRRLVAVARDWPRQQIPLAELIEAALATALRLGELCRVRWADLDAPGRLLLVRDRKHPRERIGNDQRVPLLVVGGLDALAVLLRQPRTDARIFPVRSHSVSVGFARVAEATGIADVRFHDLRHTATTRLFQAGYGIEQAALVTGHKDWATLRRYTHLSPADVVAARRD
jgi:integrase